MGNGGVAERRRVLLSQAHVTELEEQYVLEALRSGWVAPLGPSVDQFETEVADRCGVAGALALSSGTAALHLALVAVGAGPGKIVVLPTMTFGATINAVLYTGAEPVLVDCQEDGNVDPDLLIGAVDQLLKEGRSVAAVMSVDLFGRCCEYEKIVPELKERGISLVEDAAEALGASREGAGAGSFGKAAALSFNGNKILTTSGGGMLLSDDATILAWARKVSSQAREPFPWYEHKEVGYNYRMSNILAALGRAQLSRLDEMISTRRSHRDRYQEAFRNCGAVSLLGAERGSNARSVDNYWLTCIQVDHGILGTRAASGAYVDGMLDSLGEAGIEARHLWKPLHTHPLNRDRRAFLNGTSGRLFERGVVLPSGSSLTSDDIDFVAENVIDLVESAVTGAGLVKA